MLTYTSLLNENVINQLIRMEDSVDENVALKLYLG
jgi:hypothetical protein